MNLPAHDRIALMLGRSMMAGENMADAMARDRAELEGLKAEVSALRAELEKDAKK